MKRELALEFSRVTEAGALAAYKWVGRGNKNAADAAAVQAMRAMLNRIEIDGEVVIGEGEIDQAPMLYIGEKVGSGNGDRVDIAVDPVEGTRMTAMGQNNAISVLAAGERGVFLKAPDMYMEKLVCSPEAKGVIDLDKDLPQNVYNVAEALDKQIENMVVITLAKPRHGSLIQALQEMGVRVFAIPDGDVAASVLACMPFSEVDMMYCIGGAPEGVISASVIRALGGDMQGRLLTREQAKGKTAENTEASKIEHHRCQEMGVEIGVKLQMNDIASTDNVIFAATGITNGDLLQGITRIGNIATTETLVVRGRSRTVRRIQSSHYLDRQYNEIKSIIL